MGLVSRFGAATLVACAVGGAATASAATPVADRLTAQFAAMDGGGWTGGDASWSVRLPDGRTAWLFGDTFLGGVDSGGRRDPLTPMVRNSIVVESEGRLRTTVGGANGATASVVPGVSSDDWYWPGPPLVADRHSLHVPMAHIVRTGTGAWDFKAVGTSLASFALPSLKLRSLKPLAVPTGVNMASAVARTKHFTYVFGTRAAWPDGKQAFVARVRGRDLAGLWVYWDGSRWNENPDDAAEILHGVSDQFSVLRAGRHWELISQVPMSNRIVGFVARSPQGPWRSIGDIAAIPHIDHAVTYNATVHTEYCTHGELVIGYNVNADSQSDVYADAALYRPRFMTVRRASLLGPASPAPRARAVQPGSRALPAVSGG